MVKKAAITADEVRAARERMGLTPGELAVEMGVSERDLRGWEDGSVKPGRGTEQNLAFAAALLEQRAKLNASGLPECAWANEWTQELHRSSGARIAAHVQRLRDHFAACPTCTARERFLQEHGPPLPPPYAPPAFRWLARVPPWLHPAALGAAVVFAMSALNALAGGIGAALGGHFPGWSGLVPALLAATGAGASGGLVYSAVRPALRRLGRAGDYLTGIACVMVYMLSLALVSPIAFGAPFPEDRTGWTALLVLSVVFGVVVGHALFPAAERPRPLVERSS